MRVELKTRTRRGSRPILSFTSLCLFLVSGCAGGEVVTAESIRAARARWEKADVRDYDLEWESSGLSKAHYVVSVRNGRVRSIESIAHDGRRREVTSPEPKFYGVDGLFMIISDELAQLEGETPFGKPKGTKAVLRFTPDPVLGYPRSYRRDVLGSPMPLAIDVVRFAPSTTPVSGPHAPSPASTPAS
jgi:hypothetical protein